MPTRGPLCHGPGFYTGQISLLIRHLSASRACHQIQKVISHFRPHLWIQADRYKHSPRLRGSWRRKAAPPRPGPAPVRTTPHSLLLAGRGYYCIHLCWSHTGHPCSLQDQSSEKLLSQSSGIVGCRPERRWTTVLAPINKLPTLRQLEGQAPERLHRNKLNNGYWISQF